MKNLLIYILLLPLLPVSIFAQSVDIKNSFVEFEISNMAVNRVNGTIMGMEGNVDIDTNNLRNAYIDVCIDPNTIKTGFEKRDNHLKETDFFAVEEYPTICFATSKIKKTDSGYIANGKLTMHGVTNDVSIPITLQTKKVFGSFELNRKDYGIGPSGKFSVGEIVTLEIVCVIE